MADPGSDDPESETTRPVIWVGRRRIDLTTHRDPYMVQPIRMRRDAFAAGRPARDLLVSPDHAIFIDDVLIPARLLINGATIVREQRMRAVRYFHVELDRHAVLFSENLPTESYLECGNRTFFQNAGKVVRMNPDGYAVRRLPIDAEGLTQPDAAVLDEETTRENASCVPFADTPEVVRPIWQRLADRAEAMGYTVPRPAFTTDPDVRIDMAGRPFRPIVNAGGVCSSDCPLAHCPPAHCPPAHCPPVRARCASSRARRVRPTCVRGSRIAACWAFPSAASVSAMGGRDRTAAGRSRRPWRLVADGA